MLPVSVGLTWRSWDPDGEIENSGHLLYFSQFFHGSVLAKSQPLPDFKNDFPGIFNLTVGILGAVLPITPLGLEYFPTTFFGK